MFKTSCGKVISFGILTPPYADILIPSEEFALGHTGEATAEDAAKALYEKYKDTDYNFDYNPEENLDNKISSEAKNV